VATLRLIDKWGSKEVWLRALLVRLNIIWTFRDELRNLDLGNLSWLEVTLADAYIDARIGSRRYESAEDAFNFSMSLLKLKLEMRLAQTGPDEELERLLVLAESGTFCDHLQIMFNSLEIKSRTVYRRLAPRTVSLDREWLISHPKGSRIPREFSDRYHINAQTITDDDTARIELQIHLDNFDESSLLAVPALFTHELVCHAHAREDRNDDASLWAEGVMDWAAIFFFEKWCNKIGLPYGLVRNCGVGLWNSRMSPARHSGRLAADTLVEWLASEPSVRGLPVARPTAARLALEVNATPGVLRAKDALASRMANIWRDKDLQERIRAWRGATSSASELLS
jgi:hypothetical protein